jgi:hypothetical protein
MYVNGYSTAPWGYGECTGCPKRHYGSGQDAFVAKLANPCTNSIATGNWNDTATWTAGNVPGSGEWACIQNGHIVTLDTSPGVDGLIVENGGRLVIPLGFSLTAEKLMTNLGTVQQTLNVNNANVPFLEIKNVAGTITHYRGVEINTTNNLGDVTAIIQHRASSQYCTDTGGGSPAYARRCYEITPINNLPATVRLYALTTDELNGLVQANLSVYRFSDSWTELLNNRATGNDGGSYSYAEGDTPGFSHFLLGQTGVSPTTITVQNVAHSAGQSVVLWGGVVLLLLLTTAVLITRRQA